jgi:FkbM family methyltransferase
MVNAILHFLNRHGFQWLLVPIIFLGYLKNGKKVKSVSYVKELRAWVLQVGNHYFVTRGPGWAYELEFLEQEYEKYSGFCYRPKPGDVVIDVGAGLGEETLIFSEWVGPEGKVFSIEANPTTFASLKYLIEANHLKNVKTVLLAISDKVGKVSIENDDDRFLQNTIGDDSRHNSVEVDSVTLDDFFANQSIDRADFLKVNIEGAEQLLILGMSTCISRIKHISISCHDFREGEFYKTREKILRFLSEQNFKVTFQETGDPVRDNYLYGVNESIR